MVRRPDIALRVELSEGFQAHGPMAQRAVEFAQRFSQRCGGDIDGVRMHITRAPRAHSGLGTGTQLAMAVAKAMAAMIDCDDWSPGSPAQLAAMVDRGQRSAIGAYGFFHGGLIVEGGKPDAHNLAPMLMRHPFCQDWRIVLICPDNLEGLSGRRESQAFEQMPAISDQATEKMCRLVLLGLMPAAIEEDLTCFSQALFELQQIVGQCFIQQQGGLYADPVLTDIVQFVRNLGIEGVGQSSWGPTLYAVTEDEDRAKWLLKKVQDQFNLPADQLMITAGDNHGARLTTCKVQAQ